MPQFPHLQESSQLSEQFPALHSSAVSELATSAITLRFSVSESVKIFCSLYHDIQAYRISAVLLLLLLLCVNAICLLLYHSSQTTKSACPAPKFLLSITEARTRPRPRLLPCPLSPNTSASLASEKRQKTRPHLNSAHIFFLFCNFL